MYNLTFTTKDQYESQKFKLAITTLSKSIKNRLIGATSLTEAVHCAKT
jgi:hypothetical protein